MKNKLFVTGIVAVMGFLFLSVNAFAAQYYVDLNPAICSDNGGGSQAQPFCRIQKAADIVNPGDTVLIQPGIYRENLLFYRSGSAGNPITFKASAPGVIISGAVPVDETKFHPTSDPGVYEISYADIISFDPASFDEKPDWMHTLEFSFAQIDGVVTWVVPTLYPFDNSIHQATYATVDSGYYPLLQTYNALIYDDPANEKIYLVTGDREAPITHELEMLRYGSTIKFVSHVAFLTFEGLNIRHGSMYMDFEEGGGGQHDLTFRNLDFSGSTVITGGDMGGWPAERRSYNILMENIVIHDNLRGSIGHQNWHANAGWTGLTIGLTHDTVIRNVELHHHWNCEQMNNIADVSVENVFVHDCANHNFSIGGYTNLNIDHLIAINAPDSIYLQGGGGNNLSLSNSIAGLQLQAGDSDPIPYGIKLRNNITHLSISSWNPQQFDFDDVGLDSDYNLFPGYAANNDSWEGDNLTLPQWQSQFGQDMNSRAGDPLWVNPDGFDFHLQPGSPAIDSGDPSYPVPPGGGSRIDIGAFEYIPATEPPQGALSLVGDPNFNANTLPAEMRMWYDRTIAAMNSSASWVEAKAAMDDTFTYGRFLNNYTAGLLMALRATGDLQFLDRATAIWDIAKSKLADANCDSNHTTDGYLNWRWRGSNDPTYYCKDIHSMDEAMTHGIIAELAYALQVNRQLKPEYGPKADFWKDYLQNHFLAKWYSRAGGDKNVAWETEQPTGFYKRFVHPRANQLRLAYYLYKLTGDIFYKNRADQIEQQLTNHMQVNPAVPTAYQWKQQVAGSDQGWQPTNYANYFEEVIQDLHFEQFGSYAADAEMAKYASTYKDVVFPELGPPWVLMANRVDGSEQTNFAMASEAGFGRWDTNGFFTSLADIKYNADSDGTGMRIAAGMLETLSQRNDAPPPVNNPPLVSNIGDQVVNEGVIRIVPFTVADPDGDQIASVEIENNPGFLSIAADEGAGNYNLVISPNYAQAGTYPGVRIKATDINGSPAPGYSDSFTVTVNNVVTPFFCDANGVLIGQYADYEVTQGQSITMDIYAKENDVPNIVNISFGIVWPKSSLSLVVLSNTPGVNGQPAHMRLRFTPGPTTPDLTSFILQAKDQNGRFDFLGVRIHFNHSAQPKQSGGAKAIKGSK